MSRHGISLSVVMKLIVLIALNLALLGVSALPLVFPPLFYALVVLNLVVVQSVVLGRPLRAFHYTFMLVGPISYLGVIVLANALASSITLPTTGDERLVAVVAVLINLLCLAPAWVVADLIDWWARRREWGQRSKAWGQSVAAFAQGAVIGFGFFSIVVTLRFYFGTIFPERHTLGWNVHLKAMATYPVAMATCPLVGGLVVLAWSRLRRQAQEASAIVLAEAPDIQR